MKFGGDTTKQERELARELEVMELYLDDKFRKNAMPVDRIAKGYVCIAHDYYALHLEEEGNRVLDKSETTCPGYFEKFVQAHIEENEEYKAVVASLDSQLTYLLMQNMKGIKLKEDE